MFAWSVTGMTDNERDAFDVALGEDPVLARGLEVLGDAIRTVA
jgi:hypothetical protein